MTADVLTFDSTEIEYFSAIKLPCGWNFHDVGIFTRLKMVNRHFNFISDCLAVCNDAVSWSAEWHPACSQYSPKFYFSRPLESWGPIYKKNS